MGLSLLVLFLNLAGEADEVRGQIRRGVPAFDRVFEFEALDPMGFDFLPQMVRDVLGQILGDRNPRALGFLDFLAELFLAHAERARENADRVGEMLVHEHFRRFLGEQIPAQRADPALLFRGVEIVPAGFAAGFLIGEPVARHLGVQQVVLVHIHGGNRDALRQRFFAAIHDGPAGGGQLLRAVIGLARAFRIALAVHQLNLHQSPRKHAEPGHQDRGTR